MNALLACLSVRQSCPITCDEGIWREGGAEAKLQLFLSAGLDGGEWAALRPCRSKPG